MSGSRTLRRLGGGGHRDAHPLQDVELAGRDRGPPLGGRGDGHLDGDAPVGQMACGDQASTPVASGTRQERARMGAKRRMASRERARPAFSIIWMSSM